MLLEIRSTKLETVKGSGNKYDPLQLKLHGQVPHMMAQSQTQIRWAGVLLGEEAVDVAQAESQERQACCKPCVPGVPSVWSVGFKCLGFSRGQSYD